MDPTPRSVNATSPSLLARVQANQPGSWERLVDLYAPLVYHWCRRSALSPEDAADVFQEVFRSVAEHIAGFRRDRAGATFRGWLRTITRNKINDHFRRSQGRARRPAAPTPSCGCWPCRRRRTKRTRKRRGCSTARSGGPSKRFAGRVRAAHLAGVLESADRGPVHRRRGGGAGHDAGRRPQGEAARAAPAARGAGRSAGIITDPRDAPPFYGVGPPERPEQCDDRLRMPQ